MPESQLPEALAVTFIVMLVGFWFVLFSSQIQYRDPERRGVLWVYRIAAFVLVVGSSVVAGVIFSRWVF